MYNLHKDSREKRKSKDLGNTKQVALENSEQLSFVQKKLLLVMGFEPMTST